MSADDPTSLRPGVMTPVSRRRALQLAAAGAAFGLAGTALAPRRTSAQATPPATALGAYPEVTITGTDYKFALPSQFEGGFTKITFKNASTQGNTHLAVFLAPRAGKTVADITAALKNTSPAGLGQLFAVATSLGGAPGLDPGQTASVIMNLPAGQYVLICPIPGPNGMPHYAMGMQAVVTVTAPTASRSAPAAALIVDLADFAFHNLPATVPAGQQVWQVTNQGPQLHEMDIFALGPGVTAEQFKQLLSAPPPASPAAATPLAATPVASGPPPVVAMAGAGPMSPGQTVWPVLDLKAGNYAAVCFVPDQTTGKPHFLEGMFMGFTVQ